MFAQRSLSLLIVQAGGDVEREVEAYLSTWPEVGDEVRITLDGKTVRGTVPFGDTRGLHLLAAYLPGVGVVLFQVAVDTKRKVPTATYTSGLTMHSYPVGPIVGAPIQRATTSAIL